MAEWISVKERLPKYGDYVLCIGPKRGYYISEYRGLVDIPHKAWPWFMAQGRSVKITHWMPLPEPPKEVDDGN